MTIKKDFLLAASPLFLVLFIDSMGLGLVFPILNALVIDPTVHFIGDNISANLRNIIFGFTIAIYMFCWFFGAAILGDLSDQMGRKKALMICLVGAVFSYLLSALSITYQSFTLLLLGRIIAGFTAGSQSIAQAAIVDISSSEHKARNLGWMLFVVSMGFVFGPLVGGVLSGFGFVMPFYFAAAISFINAILLQIYFKETFLHTRKVEIKLHHALKIFTSAFTNEKVRELSIVLLVLIFGWSSFYAFISMFLFRVYDFTPMQIGLYMCVLGAGFGIGTGFLVERFTKILSLKNCVIGGTLVAALSTALTIFSPNQALVWIIVLPLGAFMALAYSAILTLFSNQVDEDAQGWVMGVTGAIMAFAFGLSSLLVGFLANVDTRVPLMVTVLGLSISAVLMKLIFKEGEPTQ